LYIWTFIFHFITLEAEIFRKYVLVIYYYASPEFVQNSLHQQLNHQERPP